MKVYVPMNAHRALHDGHRAVIDHAKQLGEVTVGVWVCPDACREFIDTGRKHRLREVNVAQVKRELDSLGCKQRYLSLSNSIDTSEQVRLRRQEQAAGLVGLYKDALLSPKVIDSAFISLMTRFLSSKGGKIEFGAEVRGPEILSFFLKSISNLLDFDRELVIYSKIVKDPDTEIKMQARLASLCKGDTIDYKRLSQAALGARSKFQVGRNEELVKELRLSYPHRPWKWHDILVWEGGMVQGRLELVQFEVRSPKGVLLVEEIYYES